MIDAKFAKRFVEVELVKVALVANKFVAVELVNEALVASKLRVFVFEALIFTAKIFAKVAKFPTMSSTVK